MKVRLDHVGIAVSSLQQSVELYLAAFGMTESACESLDGHGVRAAMLAFAEAENDVRLELLEPLSEDSPIARFLSRSGPGLHHLALRVDNLEEALRGLLAQGFTAVAKPQRGAGNSKVVFLHPRSTGGVLLELVEREQTEKDRNEIIGT